MFLNQLLLVSLQISVNILFFDAMFGSQKAYGGNSNNNNNYGNTSHYSSQQSSNASSTNDSFWGNRSQQQQQNRLNYSASIGSDSGTSNANDQPVPEAIANDSLYGYQTLENSENSKNEKYGNLAPSIVSSGKTTTWASIASQPAKSQPKSLKAKMAAGLTGTASKFLPPTVTMDAMSWDSKNGSISSVVSGGAKANLPPNANVISSAQSSVSSSATSVHPGPPLSPDDLYSSADVPPAQAQVGNSWSNNGGNVSPVGSITNNSDSSRQTATPNTNMHSQQNKTSNNISSMPKQSIMEHQNGNHHSNSQQANNNRYNNRLDNQPPPPPPSTNKTANATKLQPPAVRDLRDDDDDEDEEEEGVGQSDIDDQSHLLLEKLCIENNYNPTEFDLNLRNAKFFIIKSYSEDDIHRSIKYSIWCSTEHGNKRLDNAFRQQEDKGPIYLFFSVNRSGHFCGVAQMVSHVDYNASSGVWSQDKWKGQFKVKWIYVKDVPNDELRHITLENNENKPVTNSRDTQEVPYEKGKMVILIIHRFKHQTSIFDDFLHYEKKQEEELNRKPSEYGASPPPHGNNNYYNSNKPMQSNNSHHNYHHPHHGGPGGPGMMPPQPMGYRGNNHSYNNKARSYINDHGGGGGMMSGGHGRNDYGGRNQDYPPPMQNQSRNNFRSGNYNDGGGRPHNRSHDYYQRDQQYSRGDYYNSASGYNRGGGGDYYPPPPLRDYPPPNDYRGGGPDYPRDHRNHHVDRMQQSWRN